MKTRLTISLGIFFITLLHLQITTSFAQKAKLTWFPNQTDNIYSYEIYRKLKVDSGFVLINTIDHPESTYVDDSIEWNQQYDYAAKSINSTGLSSEFSDIAELQTTFPEAGRIKHSDQTHVKEVCFDFPATENDLTLIYEVYDIDTEEEVDIFLNGTKIHDERMTADLEWSSTRALLLPDSLVHDFSNNKILFVNHKNSINNKQFYWGVRKIEVLQCLSLPFTEQVGNLSNESRTDYHNAVCFSFAGQQGEVELIYEAYDIDQETELEIIVNGTHFQNQTTTTNNRWSEPDTLLLPEILINDTELNFIVFKNFRNPPKSWHWGVGNVSVISPFLSSVRIDLDTITGQNAQGVEYISNRQIKKEGRQEESLQIYSSPDLDNSKGITSITPDGHLMITLPSLQKVDDLFLFPQEGPGAFFSFKLETSQDGNEWQPLVDQSGDRLKDVQRIKLFGAKIRFLRISGAGYDVDSEQINVDDEELFYDTLEMMLQKAVPQDFVITNLALFKKQLPNNNSETKNTAPVDFSLSQNFPNPFNPTTTILFTLPKSEHVSMTLYNAAGKLVQTLIRKRLEAGLHKFAFKATDIPSGIYFYRIKAGRFSATQKMVLAK